MWCWSPRTRRGEVAGTDDVRTRRGTETRARVALIAVADSAPAGPFGPLHHIGIVVEDFAMACRNIAGLVGGRVIDQGEDGPLAARWIWIASPGSPIIELVTPTGDGPIAAYLARNGAGLHHLSYLATSLDASIEHARGCGLGIVGENRDHSGYEEFFVDPAATSGALFHSFRALSPD
jgi:methylmalonyl-CoA/ethylmalonyl-CoA epimerase